MKVLRDWREEVEIEETEIERLKVSGSLSPSTVEMSIVMLLCFRGRTKVLYSKFDKQIIIHLQATTVLV